MGWFSESARTEESASRSPAGTLPSDMSETRQAVVVARMSDAALVDAT
jgi:hypothetical protein